MGIACSGLQVLLEEVKRLPFRGDRPDPNPSFNPGTSAGVSSNVTTRGVPRLLNCDTT